ncbi:MAG: Gfo/Idh/MocA family oxidoreductase [Lentisphaerae bacterium]|jgi:predicted dehydrogenase|nr:Gfo/Idh/MocA family oxidoreductase [Lentisphaerota bacterium]MBT4817171.1 Gfo/Idh/MocA family oxidoreductase [Lentisphaerota bacterium]MBT5612187.1 Gfo/Idh/MocA family oxidoreductase [Lentisphaerota bacterium]MBT7061114.1 Gfo/Idh/MocA family oxidoreductase [Lentisphaerota bacterium]MBT7843443.1 Gfo/Idh/MocA family oxidoreductase [Lentisphaerota bacterium]
MAETLRVALAGAGKAGSLLARAFHHHPRAAVTRICSGSDASARVLAGELGVHDFGSMYSDVAADPAVDAVVVASPNAFHCEQTVSALRAGKHVYCEKPMANSVAEAETMLAAASESGRTLMLGFTERFNQPVLEAKSRIEQGEIGQPVMLLARRCHPKFIVRGRSWLNDRETGGVINYVGTHNLDLVCWLLDSQPERIYAETGRLVLPPEQEFTDSAVMTLRFRNGAIATLYESFGYPDPYPAGCDRSLEILGTKGAMTIDLMRQPLSVFSPTGTSVGDAVTWPWSAGPPEGAVAAIVDHFVEAVLDSKPVLTSGAAGMQAMVLATAASRAGATGEVQVLGGRRGP